MLLEVVDVKSKPYVGTYCIVCVLGCREWGCAL